MDETAVKAAVIGGRPGKVKFGSAFAITLIAQIVVILSGIINNVIIVRMLGPEGQGIYTLIMTASVMLLIFGGGGLVTANNYWVKKNREEASVIFANSLFFAVIAGIFTFMVYGLLGKAILLRFFTREISLFLITALPLLLILEFNQGILWGLEKYDYHNFINIFKAASLVIANIILILILKLKINAAVLGWLLVVSLTSLISTFALWREIGAGKIFPEISSLIRSLRTGIKVLCADAAWFLSMRIDLFLIAFFLGPGEVGFYSIAVLIMQLAAVIPTILGKFIFNNSIVEGKEQDKFSLHLIRVTLFYSLVFTAGVVLLGKTGIQYIFGQEFVKSFQCLSFLLPAAIAQNLNTTIGFFIAGRRAVPVNNVVNIIVILILNSGLNIWLIPRLGIVGAAIAGSISQWVYLGLVLFTAKILDVPLSFRDICVFKWADLLNGQRLNLSAGKDRK